MGLAQRWYANQHHAKALQTYRKHFDGRVSHLLAEEKRIFERPVKEVA